MRALQGLLFRQVWMGLCLVPGVMLGSMESKTGTALALGHTASAMRTGAASQLLSGSLLQHLPSLRRNLTLERKCLFQHKKQM